MILKAIRKKNENYFSNADPHGADRHPPIFQTYRKDAY